MTQVAPPTIRKDRYTDSPEEVRKYWEKLGELSDAAWREVLGSESGRTILSQICFQFSQMEEPTVVAGDAYASAMAHGQWYVGNMIKEKIISLDRRVWFDMLDKHYEHRDGAPILTRVDGDSDD